MISAWLCRRPIHTRAFSAPSTRCIKARVFSSSRSRYAQSTNQTAVDETTLQTRNIGVIAHIDAGKTTTTERMLYYSGHTRRIGDVDDGSTVTDFLPAERARGITIQSAAISFFWPPLSPGQQQPTLSNSLPRSANSHLINLIDTPGHADFTFEVLRSLRVLDGAVCILDGVAGVEAQTEKVWMQAANYSIPRIVFVNKLDRDGAAFGRTVREIGTRLGAWPAVCGIPWWNEKGRLAGIGDVINLKGLRYPEGGDGKQITLRSLDELQAEDSTMADELKAARTALVELLSEHDDQMVEKFLDADEDHVAISPQDITESLRRCVLAFPQTVAPVFAGASFRNIGVQPLLDAVVDLLPLPSERPDSQVSIGPSGIKGGLSEFLSGKMPLESSKKPESKSKAISKEKQSLALKNIETCALAFKVVADPKRGVLVYVRVYSGSIQRNATLWNTTLQNTERAQRLWKMYANEAVEIESIPSGQIGVIPGLKFARTGDTLISYTGANPKNGPPAPINSLQLKPIDVPPPVFFVSVEPNSLAEEKHIKESLDLLLREDPSLYVSVDEESGQTHLAGMGELHLEIARDRLVGDLKAKARIGKIEIGYREAISTASNSVTEVFDREVGGKSAKAGCTVIVRPSHEQQDVSSGDTTHKFSLHDNNTLVVTTPTLDGEGQTETDNSPPLPSTIPLQTLLASIQTGVSAALARGPTHAYPVHSTSIHITFDTTIDLFPNTTAAAISSAARVSVQRALKESAQASETVLMEPVMLVTISVDTDSLGSVVHDLSSARGGSVVSLGSQEISSDNKSSSFMIDNIDPARIYAPSDPFAGGHVASSTSAGSDMKQVVARVPLKEMVGYLKHLRSLTGGRGTFTMVVDEFERMSAQRQKIVFGEMFRGEDY
ncbi:Hypothetical protein R9X50_00657800 [Acrodontium crateriforme]|uniref:Ribosome-releasing factor 2, mitochondrial n=1 Tax=Acrodontium crateriforme TaxID=150365 RepID=A0AAQ3M9X7_9PEZI|nr:Hypothetical protein R9X50_00657800 [Acrodontium crateriforme]